MSTWAKNPGTTLSPSLTAFCPSLIFPHLAVFSYHFSILSSCSFSSWLQRTPKPRSSSIHLLICLLLFPCYPFYSQLRASREQFSHGMDIYGKTAVQVPGQIYAEYIVCVVGVHFCWKQRIKLENAGRFHLAQHNSDPMEMPQTTKKYIPGHLISHLTSPCEHLILANFAFIYNQETCLIPISLEY